MSRRPTTRPTPSPLGRRIRELRVQAGLSQDQLIERIYTVAGLELPYPRASEWETGKRKPTARQLQAIARALGCAVSDLLPEED